MKFVETEEKKKGQIQALDDDLESVMGGHGLIPCSGCGKMINSTLTVCPHCNTPVKI